MDSHHPPNPGKGGAGRRGARKNWAFRVRVRIPAEPRTLERLALASPPRMMHLYHLPQT